MAENEPPEGGEEPEVPEVAETRQCKYCDFAWQNTKRGRVDYMVHVRDTHKDKSKRVVREQEEAARRATTTPVADQFKTVVERVLGPVKSGLSQTLVNIFSKNAQALTSSRDKFRSWVTKYGLTSEQVSQIEDELFGIEAAAGAGQAAPGGTQVAYMPGPGGSMVPVIVLQAPVPTASGPSAPTFITLPKTEKEESDDPRVAALEGKVDQLIALIAQGQQRSATPMRRLPILGPDQKPMRDETGNILYQEIPYDPMMSAMEMMRTTFEFLKPQQPPLDAETLVLKVKDAIRGEGTKSDISPETRTLIEEVKKAAESARMEVADLKKQNEIEAAVKRAIEPIQAELRSLQTDRKGLSDSQFQMTHVERTTSAWQTFFASLMDGAREDVRPLLTNAAVSAMRSQGVSDEVIQSVVQSLGGGRSIRSAIASKIAEAEQKWVK